MSIFNKIEDSLKSDLPFVAYRKPNENKVLAFFQKNNRLFFTENFTESGFVFAPFDDKNPSVLIPENQSDFVEETINFQIDEIKETLFSSDELSKDFHIDIVEKAIKSIVNNEFKKVVLSRKETAHIKNVDIVNIFKKIISAYTNAMVYVWYHPKVGLWLGATPETLLKVKENNFETMSLAGTQVFKNTTNVVWQPKEIEEQKIVTDYIVNKLQPICKNVLAEKVATVKAGSLLHLKTKINGKFEGKNEPFLKELIKTLHPTPAVCGFPKEKAKSFIIDVENYNRAFYTGFLGELNLTNTTSLFVNLRCMQIEQQKAIIYVGGGITEDSNPEKEWEETVAKAKVLKKVL